MITNKYTAPLDSSDHVASEFSISGTSGFLPLYILPIFDTPLFRPQWSNAVQRGAVLTGSAMVRQSSAGACWKPPIRTFSYPGTPAWKHIIGRIFSSHGVISLTEEIFVDEEEIRILGGLRGDDGQTFIDVILEVRFHTPSPKKHDLISLGILSNSQRLHR